VQLIVTRPAAQAQDWVGRLRGLGVDAVALPLIRIEPVADAAPLAAAWSTIDHLALLFFVSANAVQHFFAARPREAVWPAGVRAATPGAGTADALRAAGVPAASIVAPAADAPSVDSEALWRRLKDDDWHGRRVLVVRGEDGRDWLAEQLMAAGARVDALAAYARRAPQPDAAERALLAAAAASPAAYCWLFSSSEAVRRLRALDAGAGLGASALATHPRIADAARGVGFATVRDCAPDLASVAGAARSLGVRSIQSAPS
jgi:uroporphyrinogen-III synthase